MSATVIYSPYPSLGWVLVSDSATNVFIKSNTAGRWRVAVSGSLPGSSFEGEEMQGMSRKRFNRMTGGVYIKADSSRQQFAVTS